MVLGKIKHFLGKGAKSHPPAKGESAEAESVVPPPPPVPEPEPEPEPHVAIPFIPANRNPWNMPVWDVRPVTLNLRANSRDPSCAANLASFAREDGRAFIGQLPMYPGESETNLTYRIDRTLADGVLFTPSCMEHKWAVFHHDRKIMFVRSWLRKVVAIAHYEQHEDTIEIQKIEGRFNDTGYDAFFTERMLDFLLRSHCLNMSSPVPVPETLADKPYEAALWCFSVFGNQAHYATPQAIPYEIPEIPLRSHSLLHLAVAMSKKGEIEKHLETIPFDLLAGDGLTPLHWALIAKDRSIPEFLLEKGCPVDIRSDTGTTALMQAVQQNALDHVLLLLAHKANPNARDNQGFTALHRAAELGFLATANALLKNGASKDIEVRGYTALAFAELRCDAAMIKLLSS